MPLEAPCPSERISVASRASIAAAALLLAWALAAAVPAHAQQSAPQPAVPPATQQDATPAQQPAAEAAPAATPAPAEPAVAPQTAPQTAPSTPDAAPAAPKSPASSEAGGITEDEIKQLLVGKSLYLRGGYLDDSLAFNENGKLTGHSAHGSYTLCGVEIDKVRLTKHKVELEGARYGLHFLGALPYEDPTKAVDRVRITPKNKLLKITIDREVVVKPKKEKEKKETAAKTVPAAKGASAPAASIPAGSAPAAAAATPAASDAPASTAAPQETEASDADQAKAEIAAAPAEERPADPDSVTTTTSPAHAAKVLKAALDVIFAPGLDERMMTGMPDFWKLYYEAAAARTDYRPKDAAVLRQNTVDTKARLLTTFEPGSNEFAQANGVAGMALYHTIIGADGKPGEIAVARPIGFGLDESAVDAIHNAKFEPAVKDGKPVPVMLDLVVQFRIYSKRTAAETGKPEEAAKPADSVLPGPYSVQHPQTQ